MLPFERITFTLPHFNYNVITFTNSCMAIWYYLNGAAEKRATNVTSTVCSVNRVCLKKSELMKRTTKVLSEFENLSLYEAYTMFIV